jgi:hypothetical protein
MTRPKAPQLDETNSRRYRARPGSPKRALLRWEPARYELSWGTQNFDAPHMVVDAGDERHGVDLRIFHLTHRAVVDSPHHYVKDAIVRALQVSVDTDISTEIDGRQEMQATVKAGSFIVQNDSGEQYYNTAAEFSQRYEPIDGDD